MLCDYRKSYHCGPNSVRYLQIIFSNYYSLGHNATKRPRYDEALNGQAEKLYLYWVQWMCPQRLLDILCKHRTVGDKKVSTLYYAEKNWRYIASFSINKRLLTLTRIAYVFVAAKTVQLKKALFQWVEQCQNVRVHIICQTIRHKAIKMRKLMNEKVSIEEYCHMKLSNS